MINWFKRSGKGKKSYDTNEEWILALTEPVNEHAVAQLRDILIRGLKPALHKYVDRELDQFVEDVAQDALLKILGKIDSFRGESKLITWAMKIAVREGLTELRLKRYEDISINDPEADNDSREMSSNFTSNEPQPDRLAHESQLMEIMMRIINEELTEKQKMAIQGIMIDDLPPEVVTEQIGINRNALYKLVYDARLKLKNRFEQEGFDTEEMLNSL